LNLLLPDRAEVWFLSIVDKPSLCVDIGLLPIYGMIRWLAV